MNAIFVHSEHLGSFRAKLARMLCIAKTAEEFRMIFVALGHHAL